MDVLKEEPQHGMEPQFLLQAQADGIKLRIGQMNKSVHEGIVRDIGRYEINIEENGRIVTLLKREISYLSAPRQILSPPQHQTQAAPRLSASAGTPCRPNVQQDFLDKAIRENQPLTFFLINGLRIKATIEGYDSFTILLRDNGSQCLYYKHSITTINR
jgi:host factor-I protein